MGATISCIIWMGLSLYFAIISFQAKSPFYSYINTTAIYIFGTINLVFFGISLGTLLPIYFKSYHGIKRATLFIFVALAFLLLDMLINTILFIVDRDNYVSWCIRSASLNLNSILQQVQSNGTQEPTTTGFSTEMGDFYNCSRTWEDELKFSIMMTIVMIMVYSYWAISLHSYSHKLRIDLRVMMTQNMNTRLPMMGNMMPAQGGPIVTGADIMLQ
ncbi:translation machinery-associated protein 20 [Mucor velutinosus]|uniref:Translation machinery-associated protein 20 n=1 Tax=Mucor velutinosus TaxID=708070 RepID=A0AAN7D7E6_9FUNG|nr:translation machinery-associated protein 20 [Mucor velutinosus]